MFVQIKSLAVSPPYQLFFNLKFIYKDASHARTESERIGNNFSHEAKDLKLITKHGRPKAKRTKPNKPVTRPEPPNSRPTSPMGQRNQVKRNDCEPSTVDHERFETFMGMIKTSDLEPLEQSSLDSIWARALFANRHPQLKEMLKDEINDHYLTSVKHAIVNYILLDDNEKQRLSIENCPEFYQPLTIRSPVPWGSSYAIAHRFAGENLHITSPHINQLQVLWTNEYSNASFVGLTYGADALSPEAFYKSICESSDNLRERLVAEWIPKCADIISTGLQADNDILTKAKKPPRPDQVKFIEQEKLAHYFSAASKLMERQLRDLTKSSLQQIVDFFNNYAKTRPLTNPDEYEQLDYMQPPALDIKLTKIIESDSDHPAVVPSFETMKAIITQCFDYVIEAARELPNIQAMLFGESENLRTLRAVSAQEDWVSTLINESIGVLTSNFPNVTVFIEKYASFSSLISGLIDEEISTFIHEARDMEMEDIAAKIQSIRDVRSDVHGFDFEYRLGLFHIDCSQLNQYLVAKTQEIEDRIKTDQLENNRDLNRQINKDYEEIGQRLDQEINTTAELVDTLEYFKKVQEIVKGELSARVEQSSQRLDLLIEFAELSEEDYRLNSSVFNQPEHLRSVIDFNLTKLANKRTATENDVRQRAKDIRKELARLSEAIVAYNQIESGNQSEIRKHVDELNSLRAQLEHQSNLITELNVEEDLLGMEESSYSELNENIQAIQPFITLWSTSDTFLTSSDSWLSSHFKDLDPETMTEQIDTMWRTMHKSAKTFADTGPPRRVAEQVKTRIDKFNKDMPLITALGSKGMRGRHWDAIEEIVGTDIRPDDETTLIQMLEYNLNEFIDKIEEVTGRATKEYGLEKNLEKMKADWADITFTLIPYRDTVRLPIIQN